MRANDIIRAVLDILDQADHQETTFDNAPKNCGCGKTPCETYGAQEAEQGEPLAGRFKQIFAMLSTPSAGPLANSPNEVVADIEAVTTDAGGGVNGPKHVDDIRVKDPRGFE